MPKRLLLTQSQVSVVLVTLIICGLTAVIFLVGVLVQQRTVHNLHAAIKPKAPPIVIKSLETSREGLSVIGRLANVGSSARQRLFNTEVQHDLKWSDFAYAQIVESQEEACNALILFAQLEQQRSPVPRLLVFPQQWSANKESSREDLWDLQKMLKKATRRYKALLVPVKAKASDGVLTQDTLFALDEYRRVVTLPLPGLVVNSDVLDSLFLVEPAASPVVSVSTNSRAKGENASALIIRPSREVFDSIGNDKGHESGPSSTTSSDSYAKQLQESARVGTSKSLLTTSHRLRTSVDHFNTTAFTQGTGFVHLSDPDFPSPEYDIPYEEIVKARPMDLDQGYMWERLESTYKDLRFRVCGMDLLDWPPEPAKTGKV